MADLLAQPSTAPTTLPGFEIVGKIEAQEITESSGLVASRKHPGVFWTHNDSGNSATIFAITREGKLISKFSVDAPNVDWEDIAIDDSGHLFLADIGNNTQNRSQVQVYRIAEPDPRGSVGRAIKPDRIWRLTYPARPFDAESLCIRGGEGFVVSKHRDATPAGVYRFRLDQMDRPTDLERIATLSQRLPVTGADISADGRWLAVMTVAGPSVYRIDGPWDAVGAAAAYSVVFLDPAAESICFAPGGLLATTEARRIAFFPLSDLSARGDGS